MVGFGGDQSVSLSRHVARVSVLEQIGDLAALVGIADREGDLEAEARAPSAAAAGVRGADLPGESDVPGQRRAALPRQLLDAGLLDQLLAAVVDADLVLGRAGRLAPLEGRRGGGNGARGRLGRGRGRRGCESGAGEDHGDKERHESDDERDRHRSNPVGRATGEHGGLLREHAVGIRGLAGQLTPTVPV